MDRGFALSWGILAALVPLALTWDLWIGVPWVRWSLVAACAAGAVVSFRWLCLLAFFPDDDPADAGGGAGGRGGQRAGADADGEAGSG